ncbi:alpha/beta hydrolase [[Actinomadura] parvosata]|uniref:alpha/beta hydrolase n=1 Tax=[Actinomadura] parvosata TaxID=1955412 RepID=UPI00406D2B2E
MRFPSSVLPAMLLAAVAAAAGRPEADVLPPPPALTGQALQERYAAGDRPGRQFLAISHKGDGQAIEVVGDLATARTVIVYVPGSGQSLGSFDSSYEGPGRAARALHDAAAAIEPGTAVIGWLGYDPPDLINPEIVTIWPAERGAERLRAFLTALDRALEDRAAQGAQAQGDRAQGDRTQEDRTLGEREQGERGVPEQVRISLVCHSYGSVVCGRAVAGLRVADLVVTGSPGLGAATAGDLRTGARVWAGLGSRDDVWRPGVELGPFGFGADPVSPGFGARVFDAGDATHGTYLRPGSPALKRIARIAVTGSAG